MGRRSASRSSTIGSITGNSSSGAPASDHPKKSLFVAGEAWTGVCCGSHGFAVCCGSVIS